MTLTSRQSWWRGILPASVGALPLLGGLLALYLLSPLVVLLVHLGSGAGSGLPTAGLGAALWMSLLTASISTTIITLFGVPLAWVLAHSHSRFWSAVGIGVQLPLALPPLMSGILLLAVVGPYTLIGRLTGGALTDTPAAIVVAQTFVAAPFLVIAARSAFTAVEPNLLDVAATLGHGGWSRFIRVGLPVAATGIRAGMLLSWLRAFGEFGATVILAYHPYSLPVFTFVQFGSTGLPSALPPTGVALLAAAIVLTLTHLRRRHGHRGGRRGVPMMTLRRMNGELVNSGAWPVSSARGVAADVPPGADLSFAVHTELNGFTLEVSHPGGAGHLALLGASGAGKSMTLRCIAGLAGTDVGTVSLDGRELSGLPPEVRRVGWVPQDAALFPGLTVWEQVTFGVGSDRVLASHWLDRLGLSELRDRFPEQLSGGQRQRVALIRALAQAPDLLLLDEPLSALDRPVRDELRRDLRRVQREAGIATVLVTHDPDEAAMLADEIIVLDHGRVLQSGGRGSVFTRPRSPRVARLLAIENVCTGRVVSPECLKSGETELTVDNAGVAPGSDVLWCVRAEDVILLPVEDTKPSGGDVRRFYRAQVIEVFEFGTANEVRLRFDGDLELTARTRQQVQFEPGESCGVTIAPAAITVWSHEAES